jgi:hypothetical protein
MYDREEYNKNKEKIKKRQRDYYWRKKRKYFELIGETYHKTVEIERGKFFIYI